VAFAGLLGTKLGTNDSVARRENKVWRHYPMVFCKDLSRAGERTNAHNAGAAGSSPAPAIARQMADIFLGLSPRSSPPLRFPDNRGTPAVPQPHSPQLNLSGPTPLELVSVTHQSAMASRVSLM
jgi:hypothetical protein